MTSPNRNRTVNAIETAALGLMWLIVAVATYLRFRDLGGWPLALDEYYIAKSAASVLTNGIPDFDCGGYYTRGLLYQYLVAPLLALGLNAESALRAITALSNLAMLPAVYMLGKKLDGRLLATGAVTLVALSVWELEFARFGRMYAPFQCIFMWYMVAFYGVAVEGKRNLRHVMLVLSVLSVFVWEGGLFLTALNLVPPLLFWRRFTLHDFVVPGLILGSCLALLSIDFRLWGDDQAYAPGAALEYAANRPVRGLLYILASTFADNARWIPWFTIPVGVALFAIYRLRAANAGDWRVLFCLAATLLFACVNQFGLVLAAWVVLALTEMLPPKRLARALFGSYGIALLASFVFWVLYCLNTTTWHRFFHVFDPGAELRKTFVVLFKFPNVFDAILFEYWQAIPNFTMIMTLVLVAAYLLVITQRDPRRHQGLKVIVISIVLLCVLVGMLRTQYTATRYTFFLLPLVYLVVCYIALVLARGLLTKPSTQAASFALMLAATAWVSEDHDLAHAASVSSVRTNFRIGFSAALKDHYYGRSDFRTPSEYVNDNAAEHDIIIITDLGSELYLNRLDYVYKGLRNSEFMSVTCEAGRTERWSGARLLSSEQALETVIANAQGAVWLISNAQPAKGIEEFIVDRYADKIVFVSQDESLSVFKVK